MNSSVKPQVPKIEAASLPLLLHHNVEIREVCFVFLEGGREGGRDGRKGSQREGRREEEEMILSISIFVFFLVGYLYIRRWPVDSCLSFPNASPPAPCTSHHL